MHEENKKKKSVAAQKEEEILSFWDKNKIFKKTLEKKSPKGNFVFYDGPPFATGLPHYGNLLPGVIKDVIPRYKTMRGFEVRRRWGWDCHGLPIENLIEAELGLEHKKDIEKFGVGEFNRAARNSVMRYDSDWKKIIPRIGRWVDMEESYRTMDPEYTESIWWAFKTLYEKKLIYEGYKSMHVCPRCETTLAVSEVSMGYKDITDISVTAKFELKSDPGTYLLAWTTTPWTLPGNVALAVNNETTYSKIQTEDSATKNENYIVAKELVREIFKNNKYTEIKELKGSELVGEEYKPIFNYYANDKDLKNRQRGWKIYAADFVNTEEGTGIVHIAPAFGENDMAFGKQYALPFIQHVEISGIFKSEVSDFENMAVKPKHNHQATDIEIIKYLAHHNLLFSKIKVTHSYPFCWRCDTPLLNYATSSWFVKVTTLKSKLLSVNKKINWVPPSVRLGRFGKWLEGARDWAISRSRYWGAPIPVWKCETCDKVEVIGSVSDMKKRTKSPRNTYTIMRHGEAGNNIQKVMNSEINEKFRLTPTGEKETRKAAAALKAEKIDFIIHSPLPRTSQTASIVAETLGILSKNVIKDDSLREIGFGSMEGASIDEYHTYFSSSEEKFTKRPEGGENILDVKKRVGDFLEEIESRYEGKKILLITHHTTAWQLFSAAEGWSRGTSMKKRGAKDIFIKNAQIIPLPYGAIPRNEEYELDLHRPFIDRVEIMCKCGEEMARIPEVFDCWFESGSMPFAQFHYPFENQKTFKKNFPAHFIAEGLDQTRGWFYNMLVLSVGLFDKGAFNNVIANGLILAEDGQKMSKKLQNYPDPAFIINSYGADALRYYLLSSPVVRGENLNFSEKDVKEVMNKIITRLRNVCTFYELYSKTNQLQTTEQLESTSTNVLDRWILVRLSELINKITYSLENYELDKATRPIGDFIEDLSVWYIRRSRDRFKGGDSKDFESALLTTRFVLIELAKVMAPFTPFIAEEVYRKIVGEKSAKSIHMTSWPKEEPRIPIWPNPMAFFHRIFGTSENLRILSDMSRVREIVSLALEARAKEGIRVRQPLSGLKVKNKEAGIKNNEQLVNLIKDEVNVKQVAFGANIENSIKLDTNLTTELKQEGKLRELIRNIQDLRKSKELLPTEKIDIAIETNQAGIDFISSFEKELKKSVLITSISFGEVSGEKIVIEDLSFVVQIRK